jgi:hypothetical protein
MRNMGGTLKYRALSKALNPAQRPRLGKFSYTCESRYSFTCLSARDIAYPIPTPPIA